MLCAVDCRCLHGDVDGAAVYLIPVGCTQEQQTSRGCPADSTAGDEPRDCSTGQPLASLHHSLSLPILLEAHYLDISTAMSPYNSASSHIIYFHYAANQIVLEYIGHASLMV